MRSNLTREGAQSKWWSFISLQSKWRKKPYSNWQRTIHLSLSKITWKWPRAVKKCGTSSTNSINAISLRIGHILRGRCRKSPISKSTINLRETSAITTNLAAEWEIRYSRFWGSLNASITMAAISQQKPSISLRNKWKNIKNWSQGWKFRCAIWSKMKFHIS